MNKNDETKFSELVGKKLSTEEEGVRSLWTPVAEEFDRGGPDAAKEYLDAAGQQLEERVQNLLEQIREV